jgi:multidrug efflux pump subunit AcrA (membrane-fusion protein)
LALFSCTSETEKTRPQVEELVISVYASVVVQPDDLYSVYPEANGVIERLYIREGDTLSAGQLLARIKAPNQQLTVSSAQLKTDLAKENLSGQASRLSLLEEEIETTQKQVYMDSLNYFRQKRLWEQNIGSKAELESKQLKYELSQDQLAAQKKKWQQTKLELENTLRQSQNELRKSVNNLQDFSIYSKINGRVYARYKNEGELITPQEPLAEIGATDSFLIEMQVDEVDIARIQVGQQAIITLDAFEGQTFSARVSKIYPTKDSRTQTFTVEAVFEQLPAQRYAGLSGEANIIIQRKPNALSIPTGYLLSNNKVLTDSGEVNVRIGARNLNKVEILSGIDSSTVLIKP